MANMNSLQTNETVVYSKVVGTPTIACANRKGRCLLGSATRLGSESAVATAHARRALVLVVVVHANGTNDQTQQKATPAKSKTHVDCHFLQSKVIEPSDHD